MRNNALFVFSAMMVSASAFAANITGYEIVPAQLTASRPRVFQLLEDYDDGSKLDVTANYNFSYGGGDGGVKISTFFGKQVLMGVKSGSYPIHAASKTTSATTDPTVSVQPSGVSRIAYVSGAYQQSVVGTSFAQPLIVKALDNYLNPISGVLINFVVSSGSGQLSSATVTTGADGTASDVLTAGLNWGSIVITASSPVLLQEQSSINFIETATTNATDPAILAFTVPGIPAQIQGIAFNSGFTAQVRNINGMPVASASGSVTLSAFNNSTCSNPAPGTLGGTLTSAVSGNSASFSGLTYDTAGVIYLQASMPNIKPTCSGAILVAPPVGLASSLVFSAIPSQGIQNQKIFPGFQVQEQDTNGLLTSASSDVISIQAYSDLGCSTNVSTLNNSAVASGGIASINGVTAGTPGNLYFKASTVSGLLSACAGPVLISPDSQALLAKLSFQPFNLAQVQNIQFIQGLTVQSFNPHGDLVSSGMPSISLSAFSDPTCSTASPGFNVSSSSVVAVNGISTFSGAYFSATGTFYLQASGPGGVSACSLPIAVSAPTATQPAALALGSGNTSPATTAVAGVPLPQFQIQANTTGGTPTNEGSVYITVQAYKDAQCKVVADELVRVSQIAQSGVAKFNLTFNKAATVYLGVVGEQLLPICTPAIVISPAAADKIQVVSGDNQDGSSSNVLRAQSVVKVIDAFGNPIPNMTITWAPVTGGGSLKAATSLTAADGTTSNTFIAGSILGSESFSATNATIATTNSVVFHANITQSGGGGFVATGGGLTVQARAGGMDSVVGGTTQSSADKSLSIDLDTSNTGVLVQ